jgi:hypothetical protein
MLGAVFAAAVACAGAVDDEAGPAGVFVSASVDGGVVAHDVVLGGSVGVGVDSDIFSLRLKAPVLLRVVDVAPAVDPALPSFCTWLRCEELLAGEDVALPALARALSTLRVGRPNQVFHLQAGALTATLGQGAVASRVTTAPTWDQRTSGAYAALRLPWRDLGVDVVVGDVVSPGEFVAARGVVDVVEGDSVDVAVAVDVGVDAFAAVDVVDRFGQQRPQDDRRPLTSSALSARAPLRLGVVTLAPRAEVGLTTGLSADGGTDAAAGVGGAVGVDVDVDLGVVDVRADVAGGVVSDAHRRQLFSTLYLLERRAALVGASVEHGSLVRVSAPAGAALDVRVDASVFDVVAPVLRLHTEPAPGANFVEAGVVVDAADFALSASVLRRNVNDVADVVSVDVDAVPVVGAVEAAWRFYGPLSVSVRWLRLPRFGGAGGLRIDDDVVVSLSANTVLTPR